MSNFCVGLDNGGDVGDESVLVQVGSKKGKGPPNVISTDPLASNKDLQS